MFAQYSQVCPPQGAASPVAHGIPHRAASPGPMPQPAQPILPRERTTMDKVVTILL